MTSPAISHPLHHFFLVTFETPLALPNYLIAPDSATRGKMTAPAITHPRHQYFFVTLETPFFN